jgi:hypothetical protein
VFTAAFDVLGASAVLSLRSAFPVTDAPDKTAITVLGTTPLRCVALTSLVSAVLVRAGAPAVAAAGLAEAAAVLAVPAPRPAIVTAITEATVTFLRCIHHVVLINFPSNQDE